MKDRLFYPQSQIDEESIEEILSEEEMLELDLEKIQDNRCKAQLRNLIKELEE